MKSFSASLMRATSLLQSNGRAKLARGHPHRFRHTFALELLKKGVPMEEVSILLGHSGVRITEKHSHKHMKPFFRKNRHGICVFHCGADISFHCGPR
jgi:site-specific recombinase XerD